MQTRSSSTASRRLLRQPSDAESLVVKALRRRSCPLHHCLQLREITIHNSNYCACTAFSLRTLVVEDSSCYRECADEREGSFSILPSVAIGDSFCNDAGFDLSGEHLAVL